MERTWLLLYYCLPRIADSVCPPLSLRWPSHRLAPFFRSASKLAAVFLPFITVAVVAVSSTWSVAAQLSLPCACALHSCLRSYRPDHVRCLSHRVLCLCALMVATRPYCAIVPLCRCAATPRLSYKGVVSQYVESLAAVR